MDQPEQQSSGAVGSDDTECSRQRVSRASDAQQNEREQDRGAQDHTGGNHPQATGCACLDIRGENRREEQSSRGRHNDAASRINESPEDQQQAETQHCRTQAETQQKLGQWPD
ncbi:MAG: hypothetical protein U0794_20110 [Isosphaeraceae bacterium]